MKGVGEVTGWMRYSPSKLLLLYPWSNPSLQSESKMSEVRADVLLLPLVRITISLDL